MYSVTLVLALSAGGEAPAWWWHGGDHGYYRPRWSAGYDGGFSYGFAGWGGDYYVNDQIYGPYNPRGSPHHIIWEQPGDRVAVFSPGGGGNGAPGLTPSPQEGYGPEPVRVPPGGPLGPGLLPPPGLPR
jgi:hypothetical protein